MAKKAKGTAVISISGVEKLTIQEAAKAIISILSVPGVGEQAMSEAMRTLRTLAEPKPVTVSNNVFNIKEG